MKGLSPMSVLFISAFGAAFCFTARQDPSTIWQNSQNLSKYQMAWTSLNKSENIIYHQVKATSLVSGRFQSQKGSILWTNYTCWNVKNYDLDQEQKTARRHYNALRTATNHIHFFKEPVKAVSALNYSTGNALQYEFTSRNLAQTSSEESSEESRTKVDPVIFTDGMTCDLLSVPRTNDGKGCELWVNDIYKNDIPLCCAFIFDLLCAEAGSYEVYNNRTCRDER
uniref:Lipocalin n=1 Tax=Amblyomma cajennense TaxID=34607 RepID=A0A023FS90_AMBCJ